MEHIVEPEIVYLVGDTLVPSKSFSYKDDPETGETRSAVKPQTKVFEKNLRDDMRLELVGVAEFPTKEEVFVSLVFGYHQEKKYKTSDLDNRVKTILDALEGPVYEDDAQVKMIWTHKAFLEKSEESFYRISVKILDDKTKELLKERVEAFI